MRRLFVERVLMDSERTFDGCRLSCLDAGVLWRPAEHHDETGCSIGIYLWSIFHTLLEDVVCEYRGIIQCERRTV